ncbi:hypothetical protein MMC21_004085 [Puttea exsequens]|nr:hypothetical protein [Puttea exsequens]
MEISYDKLPSAGTGWCDGLQWLNEIKSWSKTFEQLRMVPAVTNKQLADSHINILCINVPTSFLEPCKKVVSVILGERLRKAMMYPAPPSAYVLLVNGLLDARKLGLRYLALPRPELRRKQYIPYSLDPKTGRYNSIEYLSFPWYVKPTWSSRWGAKAWRTRLVGRKLPGDDGNKYAPEGWSFTELGLYALKNKRIKEMHNDQIRINRQDRGNCPFRLA